MKRNQKGVARARRVVEQHGQDFSGCEAAHPPEQNRAGAGLYPKGDLRSHRRSGRLRRDPSGQANGGINKKIGIGVFVDPDCHIRTFIVLRFVCVPLVLSLLALLSVLTVTLQSEHRAF